MTRGRGAREEPDSDSENSPIQTHQYRLVEDKNNDDDESEYEEEKVDDVRAIGERLNRVRTY